MDILYLNGKLHLSKIGYNNMFKNILRSMTTVGLLAVVVLLLTITIWQQDRTESKQIQLLAEQENSAGDCIATGGSSAESSVSGAWAKYAFSFNDPSNLLELDSKEWLPEDAEKGGMLLSYLTSDPKGLNFLTQNGADVSSLQNYITVAMMRRHFDAPTKWHPEFAYHMGRTDDYLTYTFKLRDDIYWHKPTVDMNAPENSWLKEGKTCKDKHFKNGRCRATAHDMVYALDMMLNNQVAGAAPMRSYYSNMESYKALDDFTFSITFNKKTQTQDLMVRGIFPIPEFLYAYDQDGMRYDDSIAGTKFEAHWYDPNTIGAGAYRFVEFDPGVKIVVERDARYPLGGNAFKTILFQIINEDQQRIRKMKTGELDFTGLSPSQYRVEVLEGDADSPFKNGDFSFEEYWTHTYFYIGWNNQSTYFSDKRVRNAMSHAFNADVLLDDVMMGLGKRATGPIPAFLPFYNNSLTPIPFDLKKADALLKEAGWEDRDGNGIREKTIEGQVVEFEFDLTIYGSSKEYKTIGDIFKEDLAKIGVKMNVLPTEWSMLLKKVDSKEFDAVTLAWVSGPDVDFRQIWHSSQADTPQSSNYISFRNEDADKIIEALEVEFDPAKRIELSHQFHALLYEEQPYTFFYTRRSMFYSNKKLGNVKAQTTRPYLNARSWFVQGE